MALGSHRFESNMDASKLKAGRHLILFTCTKTSEKSVKPENLPKNRLEERCPPVISSSCIWYNSGHISIFCICKTSKQKTIFSWLVQKINFKIATKWRIKVTKSFISGSEWCMLVDFTCIFSQSYQPNTLSSRIYHSKMFAVLYQNYEEQY